jgi:hypothetical protein
VNVAELMAIVLGRWVDQITATARAALGTRWIIKRAENSGV